MTKDKDSAKKPTTTISELDEMQAHAADAASLMRAFGNESRLMILCTLAEGERSVGELNQVIGTGHASPACLFTGVEVFGGEE